MDRSVRTDENNGIQETTNENEEEIVLPSPRVETGRSSKIRNLIGFWFLGLCNNFAYVIMLSAAHDILGEEENRNGTVGPTIEPPENRSGKLIPECNKIGTGAILLADILPTMIVKITAPFYVHYLPYSLKVCLVAGFAAASFPIVSFSHSISLSLFGVVCASISGGLGELTFLSLSSFFDKNVISTWSSGTGMAGVAGALSYAGFTAAGLSPRNTLLLMLVVPVLMLIMFFFVLVKPQSVAPVCCGSTPCEEERVQLLEEEDNHTFDYTDCDMNDTIFDDEKPKVTWRNKVLWLSPLLKYMIPLALVYFAEYFINQALFELIYFQHAFIPKEQQYRWYQVIYQIGVLVSRSSVNLIQIKYLWILPILQFINAGFLLLHIFLQFIPSIWIVFVFILYEGLLGGAAYVNTFYKISTEIPEERREFCMGVASIGDSVGIAVAGGVSVPVHNLLCTL